VLPTKKELSQLLASLYDAAANPDLWHVFLRDFARSYRGNSAALMMHDFRDNRHNVADQFGLDPDTLRVTYNSRKGVDDIWAKRARAVGRAGWIGVSEQLTGDVELLRSEFYNECLEPLEIRHGVFGVIEQSGPILANVSLYRSVPGEGFGAPELESLEFFIPHLRRAFQLHLRLTDLQSQSASLEAAIDMVASGILLFDAEGKIFFANAPASKLLAQGDGLAVTHNRLRALCPDESATLEELIRTATATSIGNGIDCGGAVLISRKSRPPLRVMVAPLRNSKLGKLGATAAIAFVINPECKLRPRNEILSALFDLTPAECRIALLVGDGKSLPEISAEIGVSRNTLKSQIASVYSKTGTSRQSQLARMLLQFPQNVRVPAQAQK
jgi:DNA-binding CsgD family transcriptional regulator/PAS domain-containing protein